MQRFEDDDNVYETTPSGARILRDQARVRVPLMLRDAMSADADSRGRVTTLDGSANLHRPGFRIRDDVTNDAREAAYSAYDAETSQAWRTPSGAGSKGPLGAQPGDVCTVRGGPYAEDHFGAPGHLVDEDGELVCKPDALKSTRQDAVLDHQTKMAMLYDEYDRTIENQWRHR
jgi:hypothetical protein